MPQGLEMVWHLLSTVFFLKITSLVYIIYVLYFENPFNLRKCLDLLHFFDVSDYLLNVNGEGLPGIFFTYRAPAVIQAY